MPPAPALTTLFRALGAGPTPIAFGGSHSALQTHVVEGRENPLAVIATARIYEVQKACSMTGHVRDGCWVLGNRRAWERPPRDIRATATAELDRSVADRRADIARLGTSPRRELTDKGVESNDVDRAAFRDALGRTDFYRDRKGKFGEGAWSILEKSTGKPV